MISMYYSGQAIHWNYNIIEDIWRLTARGVYAEGRQFANVEEPMNAHQIAWDSISSVCFCSTSADLRYPKKSGLPINNV